MSRIDFFSGGGISAAEAVAAADLLYLRLDCTNDPLTATLEHQSLTVTTDDTYANGTAGASFSRSFTRQLGVGDKATQVTPSAFHPVNFDFNSAQAGKTLDAGRFISENTSATASSWTRAIYAKTVPRLTGDGTIIKMDLDTSNLSGAILTPCLDLNETFLSGKVATAIGAQFSLTSSGGTTLLTALSLKASGATTNWALEVVGGHIVIDSDTDKLILGESQDAGLYYDGTDMIADPRLAVGGSGDFKILGDLEFEAVTDKVSGIENQNLVDKTAAEAISGIWTFSDTIKMTAGKWIQSANANNAFTPDLSGNAQFKSRGNMTFLIDSDADQTGKSFQLAHNTGVGLMFINDLGKGKFGAGSTTVGGGIWHIKSSSADALPVLVLEQSDIDDTFVDFQGTEAADGSRSLSSDTTSEGLKTGAISIEINGVTRWLRHYADES